MRQGCEVTSHEWNHLSTPDIYFTRRYHEAAKFVEPDFVRSVLLQWSDNGGCVWLPLILRDIVGTGYLDATSAYGYGGPWVEGEPDLRSFQSFFQEWAVEKGIISTFIRFHPIINNAESFSHVLPVEYMDQTAAWNLAGSDDLIQSMSKNHRKNWRRAVRAGVTARVRQNPDDMEGFRYLYELSMGRLSARDFYWFSDEYWGSLGDTLLEDSLLVEAVHENRVVAAAWCLVDDNNLHFHLSGTTDEGRRLGGAFICRVAAAQWGQAKGLRLAHHGGGGGTSSLLDWKSKFDQSTPLRDFHVAKIVHNEQIFTRLSDDHPTSDFFPPWRNPHVALVGHR